MEWDCGVLKYQNHKTSVILSREDFPPQLKWLTQANCHQMLWNNSSLKKPKTKQNKPTTHIYDFKENLQN